MNTTSPVSATDRSNTTPYEDAAAPRIKISLVLIFIGLFIFMVGAKPNWFGWDRSPVVGFVQISIFTVGLGIICLSGYIGLITLWWGHERTILGDIGSRLVGTGYVVAVFAGMADVFGMGSHVYPKVPYFGPWQATGVLIGQGIIALGFLFLIPYHLNRSKHIE
jgi:hypothetical protein